ncbi:MAG: hypothetical protein AAFQ67_00950 [Pseudomonadota bacterium]
MTHGATPPTSSPYLCQSKTPVNGREPAGTNFSRKNLDGKSQSIRFCGRVRVSNLGKTMGDNIKLFGQRWIFEDGNHVIRMENALNQNGFSQERITIDGEVVHEAVHNGKILMWWQTEYTIPWLTERGDSRLELQWRSGFQRAHARVLIDRERQPWSDYFTANWTGQTRVWPD